MAAALALAQAPTDKARQLFEQYVARSHAFDASVAELYADDAVIQNKRVYPGGIVRELTIPAPKFKALIVQVMPTAKARGDLNTYSEVTYAVEGSRVRIRATRFSHLKNYSSPVSILVGPSADGNWLIYEEQSESRP